MRSREFVREAAPLTTPPGSAPGQTPGKEGQDIGKLTATIADLQKQVGELQKAALQQAEQPKPAEPAQPAVNISTPQAQPKTAQGTVGSSTQPQQTTATAKPGTPMGQEPAAGQATKPAVNPPKKTPPAVSQPSQMTTMKIKQQLAKSQAGGTR